MADTPSLADYYAILQVHPSAEPEIIEAAYHRLMRKYHPDVLPPDLRSDPTLLTRVRSINVAYDLLSDPVQRAAYDATLAGKAPKIVQEIDANIETCIVLVRCARTKQEHRMLLGRRRGTNSIYQILGFEPVDLPAPLLKPPPQVAALPGPAQNGNLLRRWLAQFKPQTQDNSSNDIPPASFPSPAEINAVFDNSSTISFTDINFGGWKCPACSREITPPKGITYGWCRCNACARIYCAGGVHVTKLGEITHCPWCGRVGRISSHVHPGERVNMPVKGDIGRSAQAGKKQLKLPKQKRLSIPDKSKG